MQKIMSFACLKLFFHVIENYLHEIWACKSSVKANCKIFLHVKCTKLELTILKSKNLCIAQN